MDTSGLAYTIRPCKPEDLEQILVLENESFSDPFDRRTFTSLLSAEPDGFLVAEVGDRLLGYIVAVSRRSEGWIYSFAVEPRSRRRGLGSLLMEAALRYLSSKVHVVYLQVSVNNATAISLYEGLSFARLRRIRNYYPNGDDAFLMSLDLRRR